MESSMERSDDLEALRRVDNELYWEYMAAVMATDVLAKWICGNQIDKEEIDKLKFAATNAGISSPDIQNNEGGTYGVAYRCREELRARNIGERIDAVLPGHNFRDLCRAALRRANR